MQSIFMYSIYKDVATVGGRAGHSDLEPTTNKQFEL